MRVAIQTLGTRGDIQPYIALALGLLAEGDDVQIAAPQQFEAMARERGVPFAALPGQFLDLLDTPDGKAAIAGSRGFGAGLKLLKHIRPLMREFFDCTWSAVRHFAPDVLVYHPKSMASPHMAEKLGRPHILASPLPGFTPTSAFPSPLLPFAHLGPLNRISHALATRGANVLFGGLIRQWRAETLGLTRHRSAPAAAGTIYAYSPHVVPKPRDWGDDVLVCGYWFLDSPDWQPDAELAAFLQAGPPPIHIGFGSMPGVDAERMTEVVVEALARTGKRGLLATGGGALVPSQGTPFVRSISGAPHDRLFPHVGATVHHGGAGTTGAALRAGKPTVACPFFGDQPFWGRRIAQLGAGPPALDRRKLTPPALADALVAMDAPSYRACAARLGEAIGSESGVSTAVTYIRNAVERRAGHTV